MTWTAVLGARGRAPGPDDVLAVVPADDAPLCATAAGANGWHTDYRPATAEEAAAAERREP